MTLQPIPPTQGRPRPEPAGRLAIAALGDGAFVLGQEQRLAVATAILAALVSSSAGKDRDEATSRAVEWADALLEKLRV